MIKSVGFIVVVVIIGYVCLVAGYNMGLDVARDRYSGLISPVKVTVFNHPDGSKSGTVAFWTGEGWVNEYMLALPAEYFD